MNNSKLRKKLLEITESFCGLKLGQQIEEIEKLKKDFTHKIKLIEAMDLLKTNYNCYAFTFDLIDSYEYQNLSLRLSNIFPNSMFCNYLLSNNLKRKNRKEIKEGDYIIYFKNDIPSHSGKISHQNILSKWGTGHLWLHDIYEVPSSFGNDIKFYNAENKSELQEYYKEWVLKQKSIS